jgi:hypothetical protein
MGRCWPKSRASSAHVSVRSRQVIRQMHRHLVQIFAVYHRAAGNLRSIAMLRATLVFWF